MSGLAIGDVDADGHDEVVVPLATVPWAKPHHNIVVLARDSLSIEAQWSRNDDQTGTYEALALAQLDGDPQLEVIGAGEGALEVVDGATGALQWRIQERNPSLQIGHPVRLVVADLDGNGKSELLVGELNGTIYAIDPITGLEKWRSSPGPGFTTLRALDVFPGALGATRVGWSTSQASAMLTGTGATVWARSQPGGPMALARSPQGAVLFLADGYCINKLDPETGAEVGYGVACGSGPIEAIRVLDWPTPMLLLSKGSQLVLEEIVTYPESEAQFSHVLGGRAGEFNVIDARPVNGRYRVIVGSYAGVFRFSLRDPHLLFGDGFEDGDAP